MNMREDVLILCVTLCLAVSLISCSEEVDDTVNDVLTKSYHDGGKNGVSRLRNYDKVHEYPFVAQVIRIRDNKYLCAGTLISNRHVMIPASCVIIKGKTLTPQEIDVTLGSDNFSKNGIIYGVSKVIVHPEYSRYVLGRSYLPANNIAILVLESYVTMTENILSVEYGWRKGWKSKNPRSCESLVWLGLTEIKRKGRIGMIYYDINDSVECHDDISVRESKYYFCASSPNSIYCNQDLGMPILCDDVVFGMNAGIGKCDHYGTNELFINVTDTFVDDVINDRTPKEKGITAWYAKKKVAELPKPITPNITNGSDLTFRNDLTISGRYEFTITNNPCLLQSLRNWANITSVW